MAIERTALRLRQRAGPPPGVPLANTKKRHDLPVSPEDPSGGNMLHKMKGYMFEETASVRTRTNTETRSINLPLIEYLLGT